MYEVDSLLKRVYGGDFEKIKEQMLSLVKRKRFSDEGSLDSSDIVLITYADSIKSEDDSEKPLVVLREFLRRFLADTIKIVHILPFYPWDTDRGFSIMDYRDVDKRFGNWEDIRKLSQEFNLMFDFVLNHASINNPLVKNSLIEKHLSHSDRRYERYKRYKDFVITFSDEEKKKVEPLLKKVVRPRATPLLTHYVVYEKKGELDAVLGYLEKGGRGDLKILGEGWVWTTFSRPRKDGKEMTRQVDLNYHNPHLFLEMAKTLAFYLEKGARWIRFDAAGYLWKKLGSTCVHKKEDHLLLSVLTRLAKLFESSAITIAEVNERQSRAFEYLEEEGKKEVDLVYQFTHFVLAVYSLYKEDARLYSQWLESTAKVKGRQFVTVLGSHDGMGLKPLRDVLSEEEINKFAFSLKEKNKCLLNYSYLPGGKKVLYEVCGTAWSLINGGSNLPFSLQLKRYLAVLSLGLLVKGVPALYINSVFGSENYYPPSGLDEARTLNRESFLKEYLFKELVNDSSHYRQVYREVVNLLRIRKQEKVFNPSFPFEVVDLLNKKVVGVILESDGKERLVSLVNISSEEQRLEKLEDLVHVKEVYDLIGGKVVSLSKEIVLSPYQVMWGKYEE